MVVLLCSTYPAQLDKSHHNALTHWAAISGGNHDHHFQGRSFPHQGSQVRLDLIYAKAKVSVQQFRL